MKLGRHSIHSVSSIYVKWMKPERGYVTTDISLLSINKANKTVLTYGQHTVGHGASPCNAHLQTKHQLCILHEVMQGLGLP
jgi:hypothetical protein